MKRIKKRLVRLVPLLPKRFRFKLYRHKIDVPSQLPSDLVFKIAETKEEIESAFHLIHDQYVSKGLMKPHAKKMRLTRYHLLPTTSLLIVKWKNETIGTLTIVQDGLMGLPIDSAFDISQYRAKGLKIAEVSALAVKPGLRREAGDIFIPLTKFMWEYCRQTLGLDYLFVTCSKTHAEFYEGILLCDRLHLKRKQEYDFVNCERPVGLVLDFKKALQISKNFSQKNTRESLFYKFYLNEHFSNFHIPDRPFGAAFDISLSLEQLVQFVVKEDAMLSPLSPKDREVLRRVYGSDLTYGKESLLKGERGEFRYPVALRAYVTLKTGKQAVARVLNISRHGLVLKFPLRKAPAFNELSLLVRVGAGKVSRIKATPVWNDKKSKMGMHLTESDSEWDNYIHELEKHLESRLSLGA